MGLEFLVRGTNTVMSDDQVTEYRNYYLDYGKPYLDLIKNERIRMLAQAFWIKAPDYFFVIPASSTGKYHAAWSTDIGGLFLHVLMGMYNASELSQTFGLSEQARDCAIAAMAGHDCLKYGIDYDVRYTDMHPFLPRTYYGNYKLGNDVHKLVEPTYWEWIMGAIERHMGPLARHRSAWRTAAVCENRVGPESDIEQVVHLADYMASRSKLALIDFVVATSDAESAE